VDLMPLAAELLCQAARREPRLAARIRTTADASSVLAAVSESLSAHAWPGNVRELQNVIERITVELAYSDDAALTNEVLQSIAPELFVRQDAAGNDAALTLRQRSRRVEADEIRAALEAFNGDRDQVCEALGISKTTLWRKLNAAG
jgi:propionate catabolism operon transcriptional regulator